MPQSSKTDEPLAVIVPAQEVAPHLLVLDTGKVIHGRITARDDGYDVGLDAGQLFIPSRQVRFTASNPDDAYRKLRSTYLQFTPSIHVQIAGWCLDNDLPSHAQRELLDALRLDPGRDDARLLLQQLLRDNGRPAGVRGPETQTVNGGRPDSADQRPSPPILPDVASRSLGGFTKPVAQNFVQRVQPLISNKCATAGCHNSSKGSFAFISVRNGSTPQIADRNLAAILKHINLQSPDSSSLLTAAETSHGGLTEPALRGRTGSDQMEILRSWVRSAAAEISPAESNPRIGSARASVNGAGEQSDVTARPFVKSAGSDSADDAVMRAGGIAGPLGRELTIDETDKRTLEQIRRQNRTDAFDPNIFNQKYRSGTGPATAISEPNSN